MSILRRVWRKCAVFYVFVLGVLLVLAVQNSAWAQIDPNIESRLQELSSRVAPPPPPQQLLEATTVLTYKNDETLRALLSEKQKRGANLLSLNLKSLSTKQLRGLADQYLSEKERFDATYVLAPVKARKVTGRLTLSFSPTYESNVPKSNDDRRGDSSISANGGAKITIPVRDYDNIVIGGGAAASRYSQITSKDADTLTASVAYQFNKPKLYKAPYASPGTTTTDRLEFSLSDLTAYERGFRHETVYFITPAITWGRYNHPVTLDLCNEKNKGKEAYCYFMDLIFKVNHSLSDQTTLQNTATNLGVNLGWRIPERSVTLTLSGSAGEKFYENYPGGRNDFILTGISRVDCDVTSNTSASLEVKYIKQYSTVAKAAYDGVTVTGQLAFTFDW